MSTTPADGEADFGARTRRCPSTFSEPVNVSGTWYTLVCSSTGTKTATVTQNAASTLFALQPTTPFVGGESCTFTVIAAGVTDQDADDPYDAMLADVTVTFATNDTDPVSARDHADP